MYVQAPGQSSNTANLIVEPMEIVKFLTQHDSLDLPKCMHVLPWQTDKISIIFNEISEESQKNNEKTKSYITTLTKSIDQEDPWVKEVFGT